MADREIDVLTLAPSMKTVFEEKFSRPDMDVMLYFLTRDAPSK